MLCFNSYDLNTKTFSEIHTHRNIIALLRHVPDEENLVYFHNLSYDAAFIIKQNFEVYQPTFCDGKIL